MGLNDVKFVIINLISKHIRSFNPLHNYSVFDVGSILSLQYLGLLALKSIAGIEPELFHLQNSLIQTILMSSQMQTNQGNYKQNEIKSLIAPIHVNFCWN